MAIKKTSTKLCPVWADFEGAKVALSPVQVTDSLYVKVEEVTASKRSANAEVSFAGEKAVYRKRYSFTPKIDDSNFIKQAYEHLKTLEEFAGCEDC
jgi:hypothetical protein